MQRLCCAILKIRVRDFKHLWQRLEMIHTLISVEQWRYVRTHLNPAYIASRGLSPEEATSAGLWTESALSELCNRS